MDIEEIIQVIVDNGRIEDMHELSDILEDTIEILEQYYPEKYKKYEMKLYEMAYGCVLNEEMAKEIVSKMRPYGEKWTIEETSNIQRDYGVGFRPEDFYVVINSAYNDYNDLFAEDIEKYVRFTSDFINDEDAKQDKVYIYYTTIPE
jgi:hypothetical protein